MDKTIKRGDIYYADLNPVVGSEQGGTRPVVVISNDIGNRHGHYCRHNKPCTQKEEITYTLIFGAN